MNTLEGNRIAILFVLSVTVVAIVAIVVIGITLLVRKTLERRREYQRSRLHDFYAHKLNALLQADLEEASASTGERERLLVNLREEITRPSRYSKGVRRETLLDIMIDSARNLLGDSRSALERVFSDLGFVDEELRNLSSRHWWVRVKACRALSFMRPKVAVEPLITLLDDKDEDVRVEAAMALVDVAGVDALGPILKHLRFISPWMSLHLSKAILEIGLPAVQDLIDGLASDAPTVRSFCTEMLGSLGDVRAVAPLMIFARYAEAPLRCRALKALGVLGDDSSISLIMVNCSHEDEEVRRSAAGALGRFDTPLAVPFLRDLLLHDTVNVRLAAAEALARLGKAGRETLHELSVSADDLGRSIALQFQSEPDGMVLSL
ncbi:MAG TPA: HEAT repeat domain-containing protein [Bacteroidota bacterium]|nr:HEAT repeat domain-containing protein [Bacteroidota bacterium]